MLLTGEEPLTRDGDRGVGYTRYTETEAPLARRSSCRRRGGSSAGVKEELAVPKPRGPHARRSLDGRGGPPMSIREEELGPPQEEELRRADRRVDLKVGR